MNKEAGGGAGEARGDGVTALTAAGTTRKGVVDNGEPMIDIQYYPSQYLWASQLVNKRGSFDNMGATQAQKSMEMPRISSVSGSLSDGSRF